jgi:hypothetical protein
MRPACEGSSEFGFVFQVRRLSHIGGFGGWGPFCLCSCEFDVGVFCLPLLATVRGGTSFLFPTAKKKRSKENAYRRQPLDSALAQSSPWSESRTVRAVPSPAVHPSCFWRHRTLRPHGRTAGAAAKNIVSRSRPHATRDTSRMSVNRCHDRPNARHPSFRADIWKRSPCRPRVDRGCAGEACSAARSRVGVQLRVALAGTVLLSDHWVNCARAPATS